MDVGRMAGRGEANGRAEGVNGERNAAQGRMRGWAERRVERCESESMQRVDRKRQVDWVVGGGARWSGRHEAAKDRHCSCCRSVQSCLREMKAHIRSKEDGRVIFVPHPRGNQCARRMLKCITMCTHANTFSKP